MNINAEIKFGENYHLFILQSSPVFNKLNKISKILQKISSIIYDRYLKKHIRYLKDVCTIFYNKFLLYLQ